MSLAEAVAGMGEGPLTEDGIRAHLRPLFSRTLASDSIYLANHTLGRPLDRMHEDVAEGAKVQSERMSEAWTLWLAEEQDYRAALATLLGLERADCVVPKNSAGQGLRAVLNTLPMGATVVTTEGEFHAVAVVLAQYAALGRLRVVRVGTDRERRRTAASVVDVLRREPTTRLVVVSHVFYRDGQVFDGLPALAAECRERDASLLVDCYHSLGAVPFTMAELGCDYLIGGCYKYLRGGPGAGFLAIAPQVFARGVRPLDVGWFAEDPEASAPGSDAWRSGGPMLRSGGDGWLDGTPPILTYYQARSGLAFVRAVGVQRLREYSLAQLQYLQALLAGRGIESSGGDAGHGAFLMVSARNSVENADRIVSRLASQGIVVDAREGRLRVCPDCLTSRAELETAMAAIDACRRD